MQTSCDAENSCSQPLGQAARSSRPARLPAPLTPAARSLRRRTAHQSKDLEEAVLQMCNMLANSKDQAHHTCSCSRFSLGCTPGRTADLADEHEHVERAGLGQVHHEGDVHDAQASAPASSSLGDHARHPHIPPHWCISKQMASNALDEQQHQHGGRREDRTHHDRARVLASPPRATRATRPTAWPVRGRSIYLSRVLQ